MAEVVALELFTKAARRDLYDAYRTIKYEVFVVEEGFETLTEESDDSKAKIEPYDDHSIFVAAIPKNGEPVGVLRGTAVEDGFPHREWFQHHLTQAAVRDLLERLCTLNALAVEPSFRGTQFQWADSGVTGPIWKLLMLAMIRHFEEQGILAALATAGGALPARLLCRLGFHIIDLPSKTTMHQNPFTNIGMVFGSPSHIRVQQECGMDVVRQAANASQIAALSHYFEARARAILRPDDAVAPDASRLASDR